MILPILLLGGFLMAIPPMDKTRIKRLFVLMGRPTELTWTVRFLGKKGEENETNYSVRDPTNKKVDEVFFGGIKEPEAISGYRTAEGYQLCNQKAEWYSIVQEHYSTIEYHVTLDEYGLEGSIETSTEGGRKLLSAIINEFKPAVSLKIGHPIND